MWHYHLEGGNCTRLVGSEHGWHARGWDDWPCDATTGFVCSFIAAELPPAPPPSSPSCMNLDLNGVVDTYGDGCDDYTSYPSWCGGYDDMDFQSEQMCCACGGGILGTAPPPPPPACIEGDILGQLDSYGDGCELYTYDWWCGLFDDDDFDSME